MFSDICRRGRRTPGNTSAPEPVSRCRSRDGSRLRRQWHYMRLSARVILDRLAQIAALGCDAPRWSVEVDFRPRHHAELARPLEHERGQLERRKRDRLP